MITVYVPDIGDGLAAGIRTIGGTSIQVDCGSQDEPEAALHKGLYRILPDAFFLSHFHLDHYNGLLCHNHRSYQTYFAVREAFYPRLPEFSQRETFLFDMLAMAHWMMGDSSGSMAADFLNVLSRINYGGFKYRSLCMGDTVTVGGSRFEVLWPPRAVEDDITLKVISKAIKDFNAAADANEALRRILKTIGEQGEMQSYLSDERRSGEIPGCGERIPGSVEQRRQLPEPIRKANESLRAAANHLSLAFHEDNKFLFMGDLESHEIKQVVGNLVSQQRDHFFIVLTPHHGTHWQDDLRQIHTWYCVSSVGADLFRHVRSEYKSIADVCLITHLNGDVEIPLFLPSWYGRGYWRHWYPFQGPNNRM